MSELEVVTHNGKGKSDLSQKYPLMVSPGGIVFGMINLPRKGRLGQSINQALGQWSYHHRRSRVLNQPNIFVLELTSHCNLDCVMCPRGEPKAMTREVGHMAMPLFKKIIDEWRHYSEPTWFHGFGEPLMNPHIYEQIRYAKQKGVPYLAVSTNATLLDTLAAREILSSGLDLLLISVDGASKETYEKNRKSSRFTYEQVRDNVVGFLEQKKRVKGKTPRVVIQLIKMQSTESDWPAFQKYWSDQGADEVVFMRFTTWAGQVDSIIDLMSPEDRPKYDPRVAAKRSLPCHLLWESVYITWDGRVLPCCQDFNSEMVMGDLNKASLKAIWNGPAYRELRRQELENRNTSPICARCTFAPQIPLQPFWPLSRGTVGST